MGALATLAAIIVCVGIGSVAIRMSQPHKTHTDEPVVKAHPHHDHAA
jgi:hypothetical protein